MQPKTAYRIVNKEMRKFYKASITDLPDLSILKGLTNKKVYAALKQLEEHCVSEERRISKEWGMDYLPAKAYYSDAVNVKDILEKFHYISDRWYCAGRIKFILRVLESL